MKILDRYIARELIGPFLFGVAAFTLIFISGQYLFKLTTFVAKGAPLADVATLLALRMVPLAILTFPMATLLATLLSFGRLSGDMEVVAIMAGGVSFVRIAIPAFIMGFLVSAFGLYANEQLVPPAGRAVKATEERIARTLIAKGADVAAPTQGRSFVIQDHAGGQLQRVVIAGGFNLAEQRLEQVTYLEYGGPPGPGRRPVLVVQADQAYWDPKKKDFWIFKNGAAQVISGERREVRRLPEETYQISGRFDSMEFRLNKTPRQIVAEGQKAEEMSYRELRRYISLLGDQGSSVKTLRELEVDLHNKLAIPFTSMVFALIGAPLGLRRLRGGAAVGLGVSILIIFCYYVLWHGMSVLGENGQIPAVVASWIANVVGLVVGGILVVRAAS
jgi:lipopolysaccharide export system permease protein